MPLRLILQNADVDAEQDAGCGHKDDLAGAAGVLNGMVICAAVYLVGFAAWVLMQ